MSVLAVETADFAAAARVMSTQVADPLESALQSLRSALDGCGGMAGSDPSGVAWAGTYDRAAARALQVGASLIGASSTVASMFTQSARNYASADEASGGHPVDVPPAAQAAGRSLVAAGLLVGADSGSVAAGIATVPPSAAGGSGGSAPFGWGLIEHLVGYVWPDGHQDLLRTAASAWSAAARACEEQAYWAEYAGLGFARDRLPEGDDVLAVCRGLHGHLVAVGSIYASLAVACAELAAHIDRVHSSVEHELADLAWQTGATEVLGGLLAAASAGVSEAVAQGAEASRIAAVAERVRALIEVFLGDARAVAARVGAVLERIESVAAELRGLVSARIAVASVELARRYPIVGRIGEQAAAFRLAIGASKRVLLDIDDPKLFDPESLRGMTMSQVRASIPKEWDRYPTRSGDGEVFVDPVRNGRQIRIMSGYRGSRPDPFNDRPYAVVSQNGNKAVKVPLRGNPLAR